MIYIKNKLCLQYSELVPVIFKKTNYDYYRDNDLITIHGRGGNGRTVHIEYESMPKKQKEAVYNYYGCPYSYVCKQPLLSQIAPDPEAERFFSSYVLPNGSKLPNSNYTLTGKCQINYVRRYTECAQWLNMIIKMTSDKRTLKRELNITMSSFWDAVIDLIKVKKVDLPKSGKRLREKVKGYKQNSYDYLVETHKFGNSFSTKILGDLAKAFLHKLLSLDNLHSDVTISDEYNKWASENKLLPITPAAVSYWRKKWEVTLMLERGGKGKVYSKLAKQILRNRPSGALLYINSDDNDWDVYFKGEYEKVVISEETGRKKKVKIKTKWYRPALYVIIDTYNDYILGYAFGNTVTDELVKEAYRNAQRHVMQMTGDNYSWRQIQTDRWHISGKGTTELEKFLISTGTFTPASLENKQGKYIERSFAEEWHSVLKKLFPYNYAGNNVKAKKEYKLNWLRGFGELSSFNHSEYRVTGFGNDPFLFDNNISGHCLRVTSSLKGVNSTVRFIEVGEAYEVLIKNPSGNDTELEFPEMKYLGGYIAKDGSLGLSGYAFGNIDISERQYLYEADIYTSLGKRLGDCSIINKYLTIVVDGENKTVTFYKDYSTIDNDTILQEINAVLGTTATADFYSYGQEYYPELTDVMEICQNASATEYIPRGTVVKKVRGRLELAQNGDKVFGVALDDIPVLFDFAGEIRGKGRVLKRGFISSDSTKRFYVRATGNQLLGDKFIVNNGVLENDPNGIISLRDNGIFEINC